MFVKRTGRRVSPGAATTQYKLFVSTRLPLPIPAIAQRPDSPNWANRRSMSPPPLWSRAAHSPTASAAITPTETSASLRRLALPGVAGTPSGDSV